MPSDIRPRCACDKQDEGDPCSAPVRLRDRDGSVLCVRHFRARWHCPRCGHFRAEPHGSACLHCAAAPGKVQA